MLKLFFTFLLTLQLNCTLEIKNDGNKIKKNGKKYTLGNS